MKFWVLFGSSYQISGQFLTILSIRLFWVFLCLFLEFFGYFEYFSGSKYESIRSIWYPKITCSLRVFYYSSKLKRNQHVHKKNKIKYLLRSKCQGSERFIPKETDWYLTQKSECLNLLSLIISLIISCMHFINLHLLCLVRLKITYSVWLI